MSRPLALFIPFSFGRGVERVGVTLARELAERGINVDVVVGQGDGPYLSELGGRARLVVLGATRTLATLPKLVRYLRLVRPRAMLSAPDAGSLVALWARDLARVDSRMVVVTHAVLSHSLKRKCSAYRSLLPHLLRRTYPRADALVAVSDWVADDLARVAGVPRARIKVVANPVVHDGLFAQAQETISHPWLETRNAPVILSVGRLNQEKNYDDLLRAFASLRRRRPAHLIILGDGAEKKRLEQLARNLGVPDDVDLHGFAPNPYGYMSRASVFALSSRYEALPTVVIEALAFGCPIVAADCPGGLRQILDGGRWGRLVPVADVEAMADAMHETLDHSPDPEALRRRAMDFHVEKVVDGYLSVLGL